MKKHIIDNPATASEIIKALKISKADIKLASKAIKIALTCKKYER